jgi:hypothetical protein
MTIMRSLKRYPIHRRIFTLTLTDSSSGFRLLAFGRRAECFKWARLSSNPMFYKSTETEFWRHCEPILGIKFLCPLSRHAPFTLPLT